MKMFYKFNGKQKALFILTKLMVVVAVILMGILAIYMSGLELPTVESQLSFSLGVILILGLVGLAVLNRIKLLFKRASVGFLVMFLILLCFSYTIDVLLWGTGLIAIPLLIEDVIIMPLWTNFYYNKIGD